MFQCPDESYWELFDLQEDPNELDNLYDNPEYAGLVEEMKEELTRLRNYYADDIY